MPLLCEAPPDRPTHLELSSIRELYDSFNELFRSGDEVIQSPCGHRIVCLKHHFFHLAGILVVGTPRLFMRYEEPEIIATTAGFGKYILREGGARAKHLPSAIETYRRPDEVWEDNPKAQARWVYIKEFASKPYPFSIAFVDESENEKGEIILAPTSSFPCDKTSLRKWRNGTQILHKTRTATAGWLP
jgi:hypothetical protein